MSSTLIDGEKGLATSSSSATAVNIAPTQAEKINVEHDSEASIGAPEQGRCYCSPEDKRIMRYSALLIVAFVWPFCVGLLMGLYYLYDKYGSELVNAFAIIWCVFIACLLTGLVRNTKHVQREWGGGGRRGNTRKHASSLVHIYRLIHLLVVRPTLTVSVFVMPRSLPIRRSRMSVSLLSASYRRRSERRKRQNRNEQRRDRRHKHQHQHNKSHNPFWYR